MVYGAFRIQQQSRVAATESGMSRKLENIIHYLALSRTSLLSSGVGHWDGCECWESWHKTVLPVMHSVFKTVLWGEKKQPNTKLLFGSEISKMTARKPRSFLPHGENNLAICG